MNLMKSRDKEMHGKAWFNHSYVLRPILVLIAPYIGVVCVSMRVLSLSLFFRYYGA